MKYDKTDAKINRIFVIHNFYEGIAYIRYSYVAYDKNNAVITGASNVTSKWYIRKENGRWIVYDIDEKP